jgi:L-ascorbate metabolism protein UlaG (beta-lactamase superfamily)
LIPVSGLVPERSSSNRGNPVVRVSVIGNSTALIECNGVRILTDPYFERWGNVAYRRLNPPRPLGQQLRDVNAVLISHAHFDHVDRKYLVSLPPEIAVYGPRRTARWIALKCGHAVKGLVPWQSVRVGDVVVTAVPAHLSAPAVGFVVTAGGKSLYFAGDTYHGTFMREIARRYRPDVCLMPVTTFRIPMTMGNRGALRAAHDLRPRVIIPIHLDIQPRSPLLRRQESVSSFRALTVRAGLDVNVVMLAPGEQFAW